VSVFMLTMPLFRFSAAARSGGGKTVVHTAVIAPAEAIPSHDGH